jgi:hypothetical protein
MKSLKLYTTICAFFITAFLGCTDLKEQVIDEVLGSNNSNPENALSSAYGQMDNATFVDHSRVFALQEYSTDEALLPARGSDWGDGGVWRAIHEFTWGPDNAVVTNSWNDLNNGIVQSLTAIKSINAAVNFADKAQYLAEAKTLLAFYTYQLLDLYGQAPYRNPDDANASLEVRKAPATIDELIKDVEAQLPNLAELGQNKTHNGRLTKPAAWAFLADMYLNRAVLKDRYAATFNFSEKSVDGNSTDMDKVIEYTTKIIGSGKFQLESNYFKNFDIDNNGRQELIFVVSQDVSTLRTSSNSFAYMPVERNQKPSPANRGTNASCTTPEFYATWNGNHNDPRFSRKYQYSDGTWFMNDGTDVSMPTSSTVVGTGKTWFHFNRGMMVGQQYGPKLLSNGTDFEKTTDGRIKVFQLFCEKATTVPADFTPELNFDNPAQAVFTQVQINRGVRVFKYEFDPETGSNSNSNVDIPLYRLGGMYIMRAEAYFRKGQNALALADVNKLRTTRTREALYGNAPGTAIGALDEQTLYNEGGFEMYWEMYRRKQAIRFGKFDAAGTAKAKSPSTCRIFPIPQSTLDASKVFSQNDGY